jgi:hypothetical protein
LIIVMHRYIPLIAWGGRGAAATVQNHAIALDAPISDDIQPLRLRALMCVDNLVIG